MEAQIFLNGITIDQLAETLKHHFNIGTAKELEQPVNDLMTRSEVCKMLSITNVTLWKHTKAGKLKSYGIGNRVMYKRSEVLEAVKPLKG